MWIKRKRLDELHRMLAESYNMATVLRAEIDAQAAYIAKYTAGADPTPPGELMKRTPAQRWHWLLQLNANARHLAIEQYDEARQRALTCEREEHGRLGAELAEANDFCWTASTQLSRMIKHVQHIEDVRRAAVDSRPQSVKWGTVEIAAEFG